MHFTDRSMPLIPDRPARLTGARLRRPTPLPTLGDARAAGYLRRLLWRFAGR